MPQVVLLDLNFREMSGPEVLRRIRADERTRRLPVVILTSSNEDQDRIKAYDLGVNGYVRKPLRFGKFGSATRPRRIGEHNMIEKRDRISAARTTARTKKGRSRSEAILAATMVFETINPRPAQACGFLPSRDTGGIPSCL